VISLNSNIINSKSNLNTNSQINSVNNLLLNRPISFFQNNGQTDGTVRYYSQKSGSSYFFTDNKIVFSFMRMKRIPESCQNQMNDIINPRKNTMAIQYMRMVFSMEFKHCNPNVQIEGLQQQNETANYFTSRDERNWCTNVPCYEKITYHNLWRNIDLVCSIREDGSLKFDYIVRPGGNVEDIMIEYDGIDGLSPNEDGDLVIETPMGNFMDQRPEAYQIINGRSFNVDAKFENRARHRKEFRHGYKVSCSYDPRYTLTIDPGFVYSSYIGAPFRDEAHSVAIDTAGNAYVTGVTESLNFPTTNGFDLSYNGGQDAFVVKISPAPAVLYSSYLGGAGNDVGNGIAVDGNGNVYVTGSTDSNAFPVRNPFQTTLGGDIDAFITKFSPNQEIIYSSYLGGQDFESAYSVAVDASGNAYVTGDTESSNFPTRNAFDDSYNGSGDIFVTKISPSGRLLFSTYLGGNGFDFGGAIAVDRNGFAYVTGATFSDNFPTRNAFSATNNGLADAFITKFNQSGNIVYSSYLGGTMQDYGRSIAVDRDGNAYIAGHTFSANFPMVNAFDPTYNGMGDVFVTKINSTPAIVYSSYLGGTRVDDAAGIAADRYGNAYVTGYTASDNFPVAGAFRPVRAGFVDAYITKIDSTPQIIYSSYLGGSAVDQGSGITVDNLGNAFIVGFTDSADFPTPNGFDTTYNGARDGFITKIETPPSFNQSTMNVAMQMAQTMQQLMNMMNGEAQ
jgi:hypothetical protein